MKTKICILLIVIFSFAGVVSAQQEKNAPCTVKSYSKSSGIILCTSGMKYDPLDGVNRNVNLPKNTKISVRYVERFFGKSNTRFWKSFGVEVEIVPKPKR